jgi:DNA-binding response OmpR family regulator
MTRTFDGPAGPSRGGRDEPAPEGAAIQPGVARPAAPRILVVDTDRALLGLLEEWLAVAGYEVVSDQSHDGALDAPQTPFTLVIVDVPHPRRGGGGLLQRIARQHPGTPILALSSTFFSGIESTGGVARTLGAACVLPKPVARESLIAAVQSLLCR